MNTHQKNIFFKCAWYLLRKIPSRKHPKARNSSFSSASFVASICCALGIQKKKSDHLLESTLSSLMTQSVKKILILTIWKKIIFEILIFFLTIPIFQSLYLAPPSPPKKREKHLQLIKDCTFMFKKMPLV